MHTNVVFWHFKEVLAEFVNSRSFVSAEQESDEDVDVEKEVVADWIQ